MAQTHSHPHPVRKFRCYTRAIKNARYLQQHDPATFAKDKNAQGFGTGVPLDVLQVLHRLKPDAPELIGHAEVSNFLRKHAMPGPRGVEAAFPLFSGTVYIALITFALDLAVKLKGPDSDITQSFAVPTLDMVTMLRYAEHAIVPISNWVRQYGASTVTISPRILEYTANMTSNLVTDSDVQAWVNSIVSSNGLDPSATAIVVPCPTQISSALNLGTGGCYHSCAKVPYAVFGVGGTDITVADEADVYAMSASHEIAEMIVDPLGNWSNPEVCDPCCLNCFNRAYFDSSNDYLGTNEQRPPGGFNFAYYTAVVVKPKGAANSDTDCHATSLDCTYYSSVPVTESGSHPAPFPRGSRR